MHFMDVLLFDICKGLQNPMDIIIKQSVSLRRASFLTYRKFLDFFQVELESKHKWDSVSFFACWFFFFFRGVEGWIESLPLCIKKKQQNNQLLDTHHPPPAPSKLQKKRGEKERERIVQGGDALHHDPGGMAPPSKSLSWSEMIKKCLRWWGTVGGRLHSSIGCISLQWYLQGYRCCCCHVET